MMVMDFSNTPFLFSRNSLAWFFSIHPAYHWIGMHGEIGSSSESPVTEVHAEIHVSHERFRDKISLLPATLGLQDWGMFLTANYGSGSILFEIVNPAIDEVADAPPD
jgi:hypothetical protein